MMKIAALWNLNRNLNRNVLKIGTRTGTGTVTFQKSEPEPEIVRGPQRWKIEGSGSGSNSQRLGSADPDLHQNFMDLQH
jgi:hypothetical protein